MTQSLHHRLAIVEETGGLGTTPATPAMLLLEGGPTTPAINAPKQQSTTIRNDGNVKSSIPMNRSAGFSREQELVYPTAGEGLLAEIEAGLRAPSEAAQVSVTIAIPGGDATVTSSALFTAGVWQVGDIVRVAGVTNVTSYNRSFRISAFDSTSQLTLEGGDGYAFGSPGSGTITLTRGARMVNGTTNRSFSVEECWLDSPYNMMSWTGQRVAMVETGFQIGGKSNIRIGYVGQDGTPTTMDDGTASPGEGYAGATYTDYTESPVFDPTRSIQVVSGDVDIPAQALSVTMETRARARHATTAGATPDAIPTGTFGCRVNLTAYAAVLTLLTQYRAGTEVAVWCYMEDANGKAISVSLGTVVWDAGSLPTPGADADAIITVSGTATLTTAVDANDQDSTVRFQRFQ